MPTLESITPQLTNLQLLQELEKRIDAGTIAIEFNNHPEEAVPEASTGIINRYFILGLAIPLVLYFAWCCFSQKTIALQSSIHINDKKA